MSFFFLIFKSAFRNRLRTLLTSLGVAIAIIAFLVLRTIVAAWNAGYENSASDRMITRNKISITFEMPLSYVEKVKNLVGDKVTLRGTIYPGDWDFNVRAIYTSTSKAVDEASMWFHWKYMNESLPERRKDNVGLIITKVNDGSQSTAVGQAIDRAFASSPAETRTESEKQFQLEFLSMAGALLTAIEAISFIVLLILMLVLANTMAMATRERTTEYAVMRAIGFQPRHIVGMVLGEGFIIALVGSLLGVVLSPPLLKSLAKVMEESMGGFLGNFDLEGRAVGLAIAVSLALGMLASALPAVRAGKLKIVDALRRVE